ncbi:MAG: Shedu immune nuclease family protein [Candidatus Helarchaeota archaeon]
MNIKVESTSKKSAIGEDIILRITKSTKLLFRPELVDNVKQPKASVRGNFIFQKKKISGDWEDYKTLNLSQLKDGEWIKLEIKSAELYHLISKLEEYYQIYEKYGIIPGESEFIITDTNKAKVVEHIINDPSLISLLLQRGRADLIIDFFKWISDLEEADILLEKMKELDLGSLVKIDSLLGLTRIQKAIDKWNANQLNSVEGFWQGFFKKNAWLISQAFSYPVLIIKDKAYLGGKSILDKGGHIIDFLFQNKISSNLALVEIKTPTTKLLSGEYRDGIYSVSKELSGAIGQILCYRDSLEKEYFSLLSKFHIEGFVFNPKCLLIIGNLIREDFNELETQSFELFRNDLKSVDIITYDELFEKVKLMSELIQKTDLEP